MSIRDTLDSLSRELGRPVVLRGEYPSADLLAGYFGEDSDPDLTADMAQAAAAAYDEFDPAPSPDPAQEG